MTFADQNRYNRMFQQVMHKEGQSEINYIKIFYDSKALTNSVGNNYTEDHLMRNFLDNFQKGVNHYTQIASQQAEFSREEKCIDQKS